MGSSGDRDGLRGLEATYSGHKPDQTAAYGRLARELGLLVTGGSDYHGAAKPDIEMGSGFGSMAVPLDVLGDLKAERSRLSPRRARQDRRERAGIGS